MATTKMRKKKLYKYTPKPLTQKEGLFIEEYLKHFNATKAARNSGYDSGKKSEKGWQLLQLPHVKDVIDEKIKERYVKLNIEQDDIIRRWQAIAFYDVSVLYDKDNQFVGLHNLSPEQRIIIKSIKTKVVRTGINDYEERIVVEIYSQQEALEKLALHMGMLRTKVDNTHTYNSELTIKVQELRELGTNRLLELSRQLHKEN